MVKGKQQLEENDQNTKEMEHVYGGLDGFIPEQEELAYNTVTGILDKHARKLHTSVKLVDALPSTRKRHLEVCLAYDEVYVTRLLSVNLIMYEEEYIKHALSDMVTSFGYEYFWNDDPSG